MHHRRHTQNDGHGNSDPLNDLDINGRGSQVTASYWLQVTDALSSVKENKSQQRSIQLKHDLPLLHYFSKDYKVDKDKSNQLLPEIRQLNFLNGTNSTQYYMFTEIKNATNASNSTNSSTKAIADPFAATPSTKVSFSDAFGTSQ